MLKTSSWLVKNLSLLSHIAEDAEVVGGNDCNKIVKKSLLKNLIEALCDLNSKAKQAFTKLGQAYIKPPVF